jgi:hypothetical protein
MRRRAVHALEDQRLRRQRSQLGRGVVPRADERRVVGPQGFDGHDHDIQIRDRAVRL